MPLAEVILAFAWVFGANGFLIERQLGSSDVLPAAWLEPVAEHVRVVFHGREDWAMAFYDEDDPRVALFAPYYLAPDGLVAASRMPVDVAEYYFHALIEAALDLGSGPGSAGWLDERATELLSEVPPAHRREAYVSALADFGAHLLAMRNEIARVAGRQAAAGRDVCRHLDQPASLFGLWRRSIAGGAYAGSFFTAGDGGPPRWVQTRQSLERSDKDRFLAEILGVAWTGDPRRDFEAICPDL